MNKMLKLRITEDLKSAMKSKDTNKLGIIRVLKGEIERSEQTSTGKVELTDGEIVKIVKKLIEAIKETTNDKTELAVLDVYLPKQLSEDEIKIIVATVKQSGVSQMGDFMKHFKTNYDGQYDGKLLSNLVKEALA
jgi:uncharacterized protein YqeY